MQHLISEPITTDRLINQAELSKIVNISKSQIHRMEKCGKFPSRLKIGDRRIAWSFQEVQLWIEDQKLNRTNQISRRNLHVR